MLKEVITQDMLMPLVTEFIDVLWTYGRPVFAAFLAGVALWKLAYCIVVAFGCSKSIARRTADTVTATSDVLDACRTNK